MCNTNYHPIVSWKIHRPDLLGETASRNSARHVLYTAVRCCDLFAVNPQGRHEWCVTPHQPYVLFQLPPDSVCLFPFNDYAFSCFWGIEFELKTQFYLMNRILENVCFSYCWKAVMAVLWQLKRKGEREGWVSAWGKAQKASRMDTFQMKVRKMFSELTDPLFEIK